MYGMICFRWLKVNFHPCSIKRMCKMQPIPANIRRLSATYRSYAITKSASWIWFRSTASPILWISVTMATPIESMLKEDSVSVFVGLKVTQLLDLHSEMTRMIPMDDIKFCISSPSKRLKSAKSLKMWKLTFKEKREADKRSKVASSIHN